MLMLMMFMYVYVNFCLEIIPSKAISVTSFEIKTVYEKMTRINEMHSNSYRKLKKEK